MCQYCKANVGYEIIQDIFNGKQLKIFKGIFSLHGTEFPLCWKTMKLMSM